MSIIIIVIQSVSHAAPSTAPHMKRVMSALCNNKIINRPYNGMVV